MNLLIKNVASDFKDMKILESLNNEAFPKEERMELHEMIQLISQNTIEVTAVYDNDTFIGFYVLSIQRSTAYILFFAIEGSKRRLGYGSKVLALMKKQYANCQIVLDMEIIDKEAENIEQRKSRKKFYLHNGYYETGFFLNYNNLIMEVLCTDVKLDINNFQALLNNLKLKKISFVLTKMDLK